MSHKKKVLRLEAMRDQAAEALKAEPGLTLELEDGSTVEVPHPLFVDDETQEKIDEADTPVEIAKAILGESFDNFIENGGHSNDIVLAWTLLNGEGLGKAQS